MKTFSSDQSSAKQNTSEFFRAQKQQSAPAFFTPTIQPKLTVNQPGDVYEQEADAVADKVMRMANPEMQSKPFFNPSIQRKCAHCEEKEKKAHRKERAAESVAPIQTENYLNGLTGGRALSDSERSFFEPRFGADFSGVKIHTDAAAAQSAQNISALAYTSGNHIVFNSGQYQPETESGKRLMAHELTHVVQQQGLNYNSNKISKTPLIQRAVSSVCYSPMVWFGPTGAPGLGMLAEKLIELDYMKLMGAVFMLNSYFDNSFAGAIDPMYVAFLVSKNPSMPSWAKVAVVSTSLSRPDMMIHTSALQEYDEIKPDSPTGVPAGLTKIGIINWYMASFSLPYKMGTTYVPTPVINIASTTIAGIPIRFYLQVRRYSPGLIVYELCVETDWSVVTKAAAILLLTAIIAAILAGLPIPAPVPIPAGEAVKAEGPGKEQLTDEGGGIDWGTVGVGVAGVGLAACFLSGACEVGGLIAGAGAAAEWLTE